MAKNPSIPEYPNLFGDKQEFKNPRRTLRGVDANGNPTVTCRECNNEGSTSDFVNHKSMPDGVDTICKSCSQQLCKKWKHENRDRLLAYRAVYYAEHREEREAYYEEHREDIAAYKSARRRKFHIFWATHEPSGSKICPKCNIEKDASDFYRNASSCDGLHGYCIPCHKEHAKERGSGYRKHWKVLLEAQGYRCNPLGKKKGCGCPLTEDDNFHVDHIRPASKGGSDDLDNLQVLCARCNLAWGDRIP